MIFAYLYDPKFINPKDFDFSKIDVVNYSFGLIEDGKLKTDHLQHLDAMLKLKDGRLKIVLSIGGWGAGGFSEAVSTKTSRLAFINSIRDAVVKYGFDGVDIDWEYPTSSVAKIASAPDDLYNFTFFLDELRKALNEIRGGLLLTVAVGTGGRIPTFIEVRKLATIIDYLHLMTYDLMNTSRNLTDHHANLYPSVYKSDISADLAVQTYHRLGMPLEKMVIGAAFYGHAANTDPTETNGIHLPCTTPMFQGISYTQIKSKYLTDPEYKYYFDEDAKAPWLFNGRFFISYDDETSLFYKCQYVKDHHLGGIMFWELGSDTTGTLLEAIHKNIKS
jgi:chitinase